MPLRVKIEAFLFAGMMELADMRDLGSRAERRAGSTPVTRTMIIAEFVYQTNPAIITFMGRKSAFFCNFNEKLLPHGRKDHAGALFLPK